MTLHRSRLGFAAVLTTGALLCSTAWGATQVLDRVVGVGAADTRQMSFEVPPEERNRPEFKPSIPYYTVPTSATKGFTACQASIKGGVVCIDEGAADIREWTTPAKSQPSNLGVSLFTCADLGFTAKGGSSGCSGLALQPDAIWVAGRKSNNLYSLVKVVPAKGGSCDPGSSALASSGNKYCKINQDYATGRPLLQELNALDPELADLDPEDAYGRGVYGVELRSTILFYKDEIPAQEPVVIGSKKALGVSGNEQVLSTALTRLASGTFVYLYVTDRGRVLAINRDKNVPVEVFTISKSRDGWTACASDGDFGLTVSKFGRIYLSDRGYCRVLALQETSAELDPSQSSNYGFKLEMVDALSTSPMAPESVSVAPGVVLNLADCVGSCTYVGGTDENGVPTAGAKMSNIQVQDNGKTYMTVYKVEGIPDCRFLSDERCDETDLETPLVIGEIDGWKELNVKPLLPKEIQDLLPSSLQKMLISPQWHADPKKGYVFDALFGITEPGLEFKGVGAGEVFVKELTGNERGCVDPALGSTAVPLVTEGSQRGLVELDISTTVSENYVSIANGQSGNVDTIINSGCGSTRQVIVSWSLKPVDLVLNPVTVHRNIFNLSDQTKYRTCEHPDALGTCKPDDAIFAKLVDTLYGDLKKMLDDQACKAVDKDSAGNLISQPPLAPSYCSSLRSVWDNGRDKLDKCLTATTQPKQSAGDQNCSAFGSQLKNFITTAQSVPPAAPGGDPANRIGEVQGRAKVIEYLLDYRFLPSIPASGFCEDPANAECGMKVVP